jgi:hypothetical protein
MDFLQTATPVGGLDAQVYIDPDQIQRGSTSFYQSHAIVRQGGVSASKFFTTGNLSHELKVGFGYRYTSTDSISEWPGNQIVADGSSEFAYITRASVASVHQQQFNGFVSDTLTADRLTVNFGVRYDYGRARTLPSSVAANPAYPEILPAVQYGGSEGYPISDGSWQPRVGATYALGEKRQTLLRASYARFANLYLDGIGFASPFPSIQFIYYQWTDTNGNHLVDPGEFDPTMPYGFGNVDPSNPGAATPPNQISPNLKPTTIDEAVVGVDRELFAGLTASAHYTYRSIRAVVFNPYIGVTPGGGGYQYFGNASGSVTDPYGFGVTFDVPYYGLTIDPPPTGTVLRNRPGYGQTYQGVGLQFVKALSDHWMFRGTFSWNSWTQSVSPGSIFDPNEIVGGPNLNGGQVTGGGSVASDWVFSASGLYQLPLGFAVSGAFAGRQGFPVQYYVTVFPNDTKGSQLSILTSPVGAYRLPNVYQLDLRLQNTFTVGPVSVTPSFNVFNAANANTVLARRDRTGSYVAEKDVPFHPDSRFNQIVDFQSPRIFQVGLQVSF